MPFSLRRVIVLTPLNFKLNHTSQIGLLTRIWVKSTSKGTFPFQWRTWFSVIPMQRTITDSSPYLSAWAASPSDHLTLSLQESPDPITPPLVHRRIQPQAHQLWLCYTRYLGLTVSGRHVTSRCTNQHSYKGLQAHVSVRHGWNIYCHWPWDRQPSRLCVFIPLHARNSGWSLTHCAAQCEWMLLYGFEMWKEQTVWPLKGVNWGVEYWNAFKVSLFVRE